MNNVCPTTSNGRDPNREDVADAFEDGIAEGYKRHWKPSEEQISILGKVFAGCQLKDSERDSMVDLFYHLKDMI